jgi:hypothetical protein
VLDRPLRTSGPSGAARVIYCRFNISKRLRAATQVLTKNASLQGASSPRRRCEGPSRRTW